MRLRDRDRSRIGRNKFLEKLLRGENPFEPENGLASLFNKKRTPKTWELRKVKMPYEGPDGQCVDFLLKIAQGYASPGSTTSNEYRLALPGYTHLSAGDLRQMMSLPDEADRRKTCLGWVHEARAAAAKPLNTGVAVPHLAF